MPTEPLETLKRGLTAKEGAYRIGVSVDKFRQLAESEPELLAGAYAIPTITGADRHPLRRWTVESVDAFIDRLRRAAS